MQDVIQATNPYTPQGNIQFDANGDILDHTISIFQVKRDPAYPLGDAVHQFKYIASAPQG